MTCLGFVAAMPCLGGLHAAVPSAAVPDVTVQGYWACCEDEFEGLHGCMPWLVLLLCSPSLCVLLRLHDQPMDCAWAVVRCGVSRSGHVCILRWSSAAAVSGVWGPGVESQVQDLGSRV